MANGPNAAVPRTCLNGQSGPGSASCPRRVVHIIKTPRRCNRTRPPAMPGLVFTCRRHSASTLGRCTYTRPRRHAHTDSPIPTTDATGSSHLIRFHMVISWYCSLDRNRPVGVLGPDKSHQRLPELLMACGQAMKTPTEVAIMRHVTGNTIQNQGDSGVRSCREPFGRTTHATNATTPKAQNINHATTSMVVVHCCTLLEAYDRRPRWAKRSYLGPRSGRLLCGASGSNWL